MGTENTEETLSAEERQSGKAAFEKLLPLYHAIPANEIVSPRVDVRRAALVALGVAKKVNEPEWRELFVKLPQERFQAAALDLLELAARGAMFARAEMATAEALSSDAKLPATLVRDASAVRERMLMLAAFHLGTDEKVGPVLADIRAGSGYADLAEDLWRLSQVYRANAALLSRDPSYYLAEDPDSAERLAKAIQDELGLGSTPKQKERQQSLARAWTLLNSTYEQIARPGRWLFHDRGGEELFVTLFAAGRKPPRSRPKTEPAPEPQA